MASTAEIINDLRALAGMKHGASFDAIDRSCRRGADELERLAEENRRLRQQAAKEGKT